MTNVIVKDLEVAGKDVIKVVVYPFVHTAKVIAILGTALKDEPALKASVTNLVSAAAKIIADGALDVAAKGMNLPEDLATITDMIVFFRYFSSTFIPEVESVIKDVEVDVKLPAAA